ncbi:acetoacetate--CoA ligase [Phenylobacterium sp.]|uniref:acetoacetate--CoA ligase n=1 Tax=Phenylobacterium sp. TaxID=1871053 RepID=UPI003784DF0A
MEQELTKAMPQEGDLLWTPSQERLDRANLTAFAKWLGETRGLSFANYEEMWRWSVADIDAFWWAIWAYFDITADGDPTEVRRGEGFDVRWFPDTRLNYAEHALRNGVDKPDEIAIVHSAETRPEASLTWGELDRKVRALAIWLRKAGVEPGDRVVSYMPNTPETVIAVLATTAVGGVWSSAALEFGAMTVVERFDQIEPKVIFLADGYSFAGKRFDRRAEGAQIVAGLPTLTQVIYFDFIGAGGAPDYGLPCTAFETALQEDPGPRGDFRFERVASDHPLWILYSSGTTGRPKAIIHGHHGIVLEHLKSAYLQSDLRPTSRLMFYTTTGWMMWNVVVSGLLAGASIVLYDGSPVHEGEDKLLRLAASARATTFGASPTLVQIMRRAGIHPRRTLDLSSLEAVALSGSPVSPDIFAWIYEEIKPDVWVSSQSGGTDLCGGLVGGVPILPVYAGEIQARRLGMDVDSWDDNGVSLVDEVGELVVRQPFPSAPLGFWGDVGDVRLKETYFDTFPGIWRHGDLFRVNTRGGCFVEGRSDSTLNRFGVRIGTGEIYRVVDAIPEITDSLIVAVDIPGHEGFMPLFVQLRPGAELSEDLASEIRRKLRVEASPRHVPSEIVVAPEIPYTLTGKKMEVPIQRLLLGWAPERVASKDAMRNPGVLDWYVDFAKARRG